jgi:hypothetical protein
MKNFNLRRAFSIFDLNKSGKISEKHFRQGLLQLDLALSYDEIEDLVAMVNSQHTVTSSAIKSTQLSSDQAQIFYEDFILALDENVKKRKGEMGE